MSSLSDEVIDYEQWVKIVGRTDLIEKGELFNVAGKCPFKVCPLLGYEFMEVFSE